MNFNNWLDTFISEKGINRDHNLQAEGELTGWNLIPVEVVIEHLKITSPSEQAEAKSILVKIDFHNGDVMHFLQYLAEGIAK